MSEEVCKKIYRNYSVEDLIATPFVLTLIKLRILCIFFNALLGTATDKSFPLNFRKISAAMHVTMSYTVVLL